MAQRPIGMLPGRCAVNLPSIPTNLGIPGLMGPPMRQKRTMTLEKLESLELDALEAEMIGNLETCEFDMVNNRYPIGLQFLEEDLSKESTVDDDSWRMGLQEYNNSEDEVVEVLGSFVDEELSFSPQERSSSRGDSGDDNRMEISGEDQRQAQTTPGRIREEASSMEEIMNRTMRDVELYAYSSLSSSSSEGNHQPIEVSVPGANNAGQLDAEVRPPPPLGSPDGDELPVQVENMETSGESREELNVTPEDQGIPPPVASAPTRTSTNPRRFRPLASRLTTPGTDSSETHRFSRLRFPRDVRTFNLDDLDSSDEGE